MSAWLEKPKAKALGYLQASGVSCGSLLLTLPLVGAGLGQVEVGEDAVDVVSGDVGGGLGRGVQGGHDGVDRGAGFGGEGHVAEVDEVEGGFADAEDERAALLEGDVGGAVDEGLGEAMGDGGEGSHGAGEDEHGVGGVGARGDVGADVFVGVLLDLGRIFLWKRVPRSFSTRLLRPERESSSARTRREDSETTRSM